jgi:hypothetical protein
MLVWVRNIACVSASCNTMCMRQRDVSLYFFLSISRISISGHFAEFAQLQLHTHLIVVKFYCVIFVFHIAFLSTTYFWISISAQVANFGVHRTLCPVVWRQGVCLYFLLCVVMTRMNICIRVAMYCIDSRTRDHTSCSSSPHALVHTLIALGYTSSLRPHTLVTEGLMH